MRDPILLLSLVGAATVAACSGTTVSPAGSTTSTSSSSGVGGSGGQGTGGSTSSTGGSGGASEGDIKGTAVDTYIAEGGETKVPLTTSSMVRADYRLADGSWKSVDGVVAADGSFVIKGVPKGAFMIELGDPASPTLFYTDQRNLDLGTAYSQRADTKRLTQTTNLKLDIDGLVPWDPTSFLEVYSQGAGVFSLLDGTLLTMGATSLNGFVADASQFYGPNAIDTTKGDVAYLTESTIGFDGPLSYSSLARVLKFPMLTQVDGKPNSIMGSMSAPPDAKPLNFTLVRSSFAKLLADVAPNASSDGMGLTVQVDPGGKGRGTASFLPDLYSAIDDGGSTDVQVSVSYADPFPMGWQRVVQSVAFMSVPDVIPGTNTPSALTAIAFSQVDADAVEGKSLDFTIGPPRAVKIGTLPGDQPQNGVGVAPLLSWTAPAIGTVTTYNVQIREIKAGTGFAHSVAFLSTSVPELPIPPGLLVAGHYYYARISATTGTTADKPFRYGTTYASVDTLTQPFTP
jgi:hypothetical protein